MPEYPETVASSTTSRRMFALHMQVPRNNPAGRQITFEEEQVIVIGTKVSSSVSGSVSAPLVPAEVFALLNPATGAATGQTATHADLYRMLYSLYVDLATKRDAVVPPP